jgi:hypothetical protein
VRLSASDATAGEIREVCIHGASETELIAEGAA